MAHSAGVSLPITFALFHVKVVVMTYLYMSVPIQTKSYYPGRSVRDLRTLGHDLWRTDT